MNNGWLKEKGKCDVRCLALWGAKSYTNEEVATKMVGEYYAAVE